MYVCALVSTQSSPSAYQRHQKTTFPRTPFPIWSQVRLANERPSCVRCIKLEKRKPLLSGDCCQMWAEVRFIEASRELLKTTCSAAAAETLGNTGAGPGLWWQVLRPLTMSPIFSKRGVRHTSFKNPSFQEQSGGFSFPHWILPYRLTDGSGGGQGNKGESGKGHGKAMLTFSTRWLVSI